MKKLIKKSLILIALFYFNNYAFADIPYYLDFRSAGNAALIAFTKALGAEMQKYDVRVFGINPSATDTDRVRSLFRQRAEAKFGDADRWQEMLDTDSLPFGRLKSADEVAALAALSHCIFFKLPLVTSVNLS